MKKILFLLGIVACLTAVSKSSFEGRIWDTKTHNINQVELQITNYGKFGPVQWPVGSGQNYIYGAGIWFGTVDSTTGDTLVTIGYGPSGGESEFVPGLYNQNPDAPYVIIYMYPDPWPAPHDTFPMAPQDTVSHQDSWCCFNDCDSNYHIPGDTRPIGIEIYQTVYAWDIPEIASMIFFIYNIKNVSGHNLYDCYFGVCADCDIGNEAGVSANDICTCIIERTYIINGDTIFVDDVAYQWQNEMEPGTPPWWPGAIGFDLLQTPFDLEWGQDKDDDGIPDQYERDSSYYWNNLPQWMWDVDNDGVPDWRDASENPQLGMTAFKKFTLDLEPGTDPERYLTLAGYNYITGQYEPYDTIIPPPDDQRFLMSSGPFDLESDSIVTILFALFFSEWDSLAGLPDTAVALTDKWAQLYYDMYWFLYTGIQEHSAIEKFKTSLTVHPNPLLNYAKISFSLPKSGSVSLTLYNTAGQLVREVIDEYTSAGNYTIDLSTKGLAQGTYFLVLETPHYKTSRSLVILR